MDTQWGVVTQLSPLLVRIAGDVVDSPVGITNDVTLAVNDKVALVRIGSVGWWVAGTIVPS